MNFGINHEIFHVLWPNKVCTFWSNNCLLRRHIDTFQIISNLLDVTTNIQHICTGISKNVLDYHYIHYITRSNLTISNIYCN